MMVAQLVFEITVLLFEVYEYVCSGRAVKRRDSAEGIEKDYPVEGYRLVYRGALRAVG